MPEITRFYGIVITMYFLGKEHNPPHFHAKYGKCKGEFNLTDLKMVQGNLPIKAQKLVREWAGKYRKELLDMWQTQEFIRLKPLE